MSTNPTLPNYPSDAGDENDPNNDPGSIQECEQKIDSLEDRVAACEAKLGIQPPADESDTLQSSLAATKPFGAGTRMSNS